LKTRIVHKNKFLTGELTIIDHHEKRDSSHFRNFLKDDISQPERIPAEFRTRQTGSRQRWLAMSGRR
jgi:hypothetical protein